MGLQIMVRFFKQEVYGTLINFIRGSIDVPTVELLFYLFGFSCFDNVKVTTD